VLAQSPWYPPKLASRFSSFINIFYFWRCNKLSTLSSHTYRLVSASLSINIAFNSFIQFDWNAAALKRHRRLYIVRSTGHYVRTDISVDCAWVAQMTGLPTRLHLAMHIFWARKTFSVGISTPRSPRAIIMPSDTSNISLNLQHVHNWRFQPWHLLALFHCLARTVLSGVV